MIEYIKKFFAYIGLMREGMKETKGTLDEVNATLDSAIETKNQGKAIEEKFKELMK